MPGVLGMRMVLRTDELLFGNKFLILGLGGSRKGPININYAKYGDKDGEGYRAKCGYGAYMSNFVFHDCTVACLLYHSVPKSQMIPKNRVIHIL